MWEKLEDHSKHEQRLLLVDSHYNQVSRVNSELLESAWETKQRLFRFDESRRNWELRLKSWESTLDSHEDRESSVNLLLNGTVHVQVEFCS